MITCRAIFSQIQLTQLNRPNNFESAQHIMRLILASSSKYRREMLARLQLPFDTESPDIDESPLPGEHPRQLARRLSAAKADTVASRYPGAVDRKSTRQNSSHKCAYRMPSSAVKKK